MITHKIFPGPDRGYILLDILVALFIIGFGLAVSLGVIDTAALANAQAENSLQAINLAASQMDQVIYNLKVNNCCPDEYLTGSISKRCGRFESMIGAKWDSAGLLLVTVRIQWLERGELREYLLESLCHVQED